MTPLDIDALVPRARAGDEAAWAALVESFRPMLDRRAARLIDARHPHHSSTELAQEAIIRVVRSQDRFNRWDTPENTMASLGCLLVVTLKRLADNWGRDERTAKRTPPGPRVPTAADTSAGSAAHPPDPAPPTNELSLDLAVALNRLDRQARELVVGVHFERRTYEELAELHRLSVAVVHKKLTAARKRLGTLMRDWE